MSTYGLVVWYHCLVLSGWEHLWGIFEEELYNCDFDCAYDCDI